MSGRVGSAASEGRNPWKHRIAGGSKAAKGPDGGPPAWAFHLHGRLLEPSGDPPQKGVPPAPEPFSHYLRSVRWAALPFLVRCTGNARTVLDCGATTVHGKHCHLLLRRCRIELMPEGKGQQPAEALRWSAAQHTEPAREVFEIRCVCGWPDGNMPQEEASL
jgi:hypothetical protein